MSWPEPVLLRLPAPLTVPLKTMLEPVSTTEGAVTLMAPRQISPDAWMPDKVPPASTKALLRSL